MGIEGTWFIKWIMRDGQKVADYAGKIGPRIGTDVISVYLVNWITEDLDFYIWNVVRLDNCQILEDEDDWSRIITSQFNKQMNEEAPAHVAESVPAEVVTKFHVFSFDDYYPSGGMDDYDESFNTIEDAREFAKGLKTENWQIVFTRQDGTLYTEEEWNG